MEITSEADIMSTEQFNFAVLTISDRCSNGERQDESGPLVKKLVEQNLNGHCNFYEIVPDDREGIENDLKLLCDNVDCALVLTTGGTGLAPRDHTPEATMAIMEREIPGIAENIRHAGLKHTPLAILSRGVCGLRNQTIIINLSGSPKAVSEQLETLYPILPHAIESAAGRTKDCARD